MPSDGLGRAGVPTADLIAEGGRGEADALCWWDEGDGGDNVAVIGWRRLEGGDIAEPLYRLVVGLRNEVAWPRGGGEVMR